MMRTGSVNPRVSVVRLAVWWGAAMMATGGFLAALEKTAPLILERERLLSHGELNSLALEKLREATEKKWVLTREERKRLTDEAVSYLERAHQLRPNSVHYLFSWASNLYDAANLSDPPDLSQIAKAVALAERAWEMTDRTWKNPGFFLARYYGENGEAAKAKSILERLIEVHPELAEAYDRSVEIAVAEGSFQEAIETLDRKAEAENGRRSPKDADFLGRLLFRTGDYRRAREEFKGLTTGAGERIHWLLAGLASVGLHEDVAAIRDFRTYNETLSPGENWPKAESLGIGVYPENLFPMAAYACLESRLQGPPQQ